MLIAIESEDVTEVDGSGSLDERPGSGDSVTQDSSLHVGDHSNYARRKLDQLQEKLNNKMQVCLRCCSRCKNLRCLS